MNTEICKSYPEVLDQLSHEELLHMIFCISINSPYTFVEYGELPYITGANESTAAELYRTLRKLQKHQILEYINATLEEESARRAKERNVSKKEAYDGLIFFLRHTFQKILMKYTEHISSDPARENLILLCKDHNFESPCCPNNMYVYVSIFSEFWDRYCCVNNLKQIISFTKDTIFCKLHYLEFKKPKLRLDSSYPGTNLSTIMGLNVPYRGELSLLFESECGAFFKTAGQYAYAPGSDLHITTNIDSPESRQDIQFPIENINNPKHFLMNNRDCVVASVGKLHNIMLSLSNILDCVRNMKNYNYPAEGTKKKFVKDKTFMFDFGTNAPFFIKNCGAT